MGTKAKRIFTFLQTSQSLAPLASFRALFGLVMLVSVLRFVAKGWVESLYLEPGFFFTYPGFGWVQPLGNMGTYALFVVMAIGAIGIALGYYYRLSSLLFFLSFTYVELIDQSNYLNHYYFVSLVVFLLIFLPAHQQFSLDARKRRRKKSELPDVGSLVLKNDNEDHWLDESHQDNAFAPRWITMILPIQISLVYVFAGMAKIQSEWLLEALPLKIWLPAQNHLPVVGPLLAMPLTAYLFSWIGMFYDLTLPLWLNIRSTRPWAFAMAIAFHSITAMLFPIGMFPWIMLSACILFFPAKSHQKWQQWILQFPLSLKKRIGLASSERDRDWFKNQSQTSNKASTTAPGVSQIVDSNGSNELKSYKIPYHRVAKPRILIAGVCFWFFLQLAIPLRHCLYPGSLFWTESGYRFSWRVMLIEKAGYVSFKVQDRASDRREIVRVSDYLTPQQEKMMATQPDMILQFAGFIKEEYQKNGLQQPQIFADSWVSLNGRGSRRFVRPDVDLSLVKRSQPRTSWLEDPWVRREEESTSETEEQTEARMDNPSDINHRLLMTAQLP